MSNLISCPQCGATFDIDQALSSEVEKKLRSEFNSKFAGEKTKLEEQLRREAEEKLRKEAEEARSKISKEIEAEKSRLATEMSDLKAANDEKDRRLKEAQAAELELRKKAREAEELKRTLQLELERKVEAERKQFQEEISKRVTEENRLRDAEKERQLQMMREQVEEMKRKMELSSQQAQGETLELELEKTLKEVFRTDTVEPVGKGVRGADVLQRVITERGNFAGTIIWESKRTQNWANDWIDKLKEDTRTAKADIAILVTTAMPKDVEHIGNIEGIWVTDLQSAMGLASALRSGLIEVARTKAVMTGAQDKQAVAYQYLSSNEFRQRIQAMVEPLIDIKTSINKQRVSIERAWSEQEKLLQRSITGTAGFVGDLEAILGRIEGIPVLQLESGK
ncbi:MAG: DUF2130 domain-containing protein [Bacteroidetes bacterium]|nr:DUF2130 domain-containing protein [Bacteroidota bacterium]